MFEVKAPSLKTGWLNRLVVAIGTFILFSSSAFLKRAICAARSEGEDPKGIKSSSWKVTPHHLLLTDELTKSYDPVYKVNPPLRTEADVMALREGLADGTIDIVATDHAPHPAESKECEWQYAAFGMLGLETAISIVWQTMVESKLVSIETLQERMSTKPAEIGRYHSQGKALEVGAPANLTLFAPNRPWKVDRDLVASKSKNTPFHGMEFNGSVVATFFNGRMSWEA